MTLCAREEKKNRERVGGRQLESPAKNLGVFICNGNKERAASELESDFALVGALPRTNVSWWCFLLLAGRDAALAVSEKKVWRATASWSVSLAATPAAITGLVCVSALPTVLSAAAATQSAATAETQTANWTARS